MLLRRMLLFASLLLVTGAIISALAPREDRATAPPRTTPAPAAAATAQRHIEATLPGERTVRARVGDQVTLRVRSGDSDLAEIEGLGVSQPAEQDIPAVIDFVAPAAGSYPVTLSLAGRTVGTVEVSPAR
jgi:hypothetical protein